MRTASEYMERAEEVLLHTYNRFPWFLTGERVYTFMTWKERNTWISARESRCLPWDTITRTLTRP